MLFDPSEIHFPHLSNWHDKPNFTFKFDSVLKNTARVPGTQVINKYH